MPATSDEEIQRQHQEAILLVEGDGKDTKPMPCAPRNELGEISLGDKTQPTFPFAFYDRSKSKGGETDETESESSDSEASSSSTPSSSTYSRPLLDRPLLRNPLCWSTRGFVDVSKLQEMVREGYDRDYRNLEHLREQQQQEEEELSPTNYWDPRNADRDNVTLTRPSHDAWGIGKIVLVFSDDFLTRVYEFPWWKEFEPALRPILDVLCPEQQQQQQPSSSSSSSQSSKRSSGKKAVVVRALLASLPPGATIPVHHDSGEWVKKTHRVHVPILVKDPSRVVFRCGPSTELMQRISCEPGHVFEINNQAKHAVSNCDDAHRVHLIVDYVVEQEEKEDCADGDGDGDTGNATQQPQPLLQKQKQPTLLTPIPLEPGEKLVQTRRSVDRLKNMVPRPTPSYIVLGAQKAGTTSLYHYINEHPWVFKARRRETHCLDWRWNDKLRTKTKQLEHCQNFFFAEEMSTRPSCLTGDSTPSYLLDSRRVIPRLKRVFEWSHTTTTTTVDTSKNLNKNKNKNNTAQQQQQQQPPPNNGKMKFFVMMRDPVQRAASHYAMVTSTDGTPAQLKTRGMEWKGKSLGKVIELELIRMRNCGLIPYWNIEEGGRLDQDAFDRFVGSPREAEAWDRYLRQHVPLNTGSYGLLTRGMYAVQLRPWFEAFDRDQFLCLKMESMKATNGVKDTMQKVWAHLDLPNHPIVDESARNSRDYDAMDPKIKDYLQRFFQPHNRVLASVLQETTSEEWIDPWPYDNQR
eukprot:CAMPEP_0172380400 /NCGR_PEP_ID=MMETSP1060-20121228/70420_1 /TAXON_ID=37318 /ORGANISM="Pseudo-nitzschia pungens, Strain cf. cingulata" /LENGTH=745 /DNA_ID=CAMNT_0013108153 /DNA_START=31 /DNA_END=2268 /DNA_ORIENTATION=+